MPFIEPTLPAFLEHFEQLNEASEAQWGEMSVQRMVEHLSDTLRLSCSDHNYKQIIPEEKVGKMQGFLNTEHPMPKNFNVEFATPEMSLRNPDLKSAIEEFKDAWNSFDGYFAAHPEATTLHPNFGRLAYPQWLKLHSKHFTHHMEQFGA